MGNACCSSDSKGLFYDSNRNELGNGQAPEPFKERLSIEPDHLQLSYDSEKLYALIQ